MIKVGNFKVDIQHHYDVNGKEVTVTQVFNTEDKLLTRGKVTRHVHDKKCKKEAMKRGLAKAFTGSKIPKTERRNFWEAYRTMTKIPRW